MGSMTKVMQKLQDAEADAAALAADVDSAPAAGFDAAPAGSDTPTVSESDFTPEAKTPATAATSGFVAAPLRATAPPTPQPGTNGQAVAWDAQRVDPVVVAFHDRYSAICEQYRSVRARLLTMNPTHVPQLVAITSAIPEEGKSVSTLNLGLIMAEGGEHQILIADADFRRSSIGRMLGVPDHPGLAEVLRGELTLEAALRSTPFPNLKLLPAGRVRENAYGEMLNGPNTAAVLGSLRERFDYAFIDTPPVTTVSDVSQLAPYCDGAILVVEMRRTPEPTVQQAVRTLQANNVKILGCVLSRYRDRGAGYYANYYSSYYYR